MHPARYDLLLQRQANAEVELAVAFDLSWTIQHDLDITTQKLRKRANSLHTDPTTRDLGHDLRTGNAWDEDRMGDLILAGVGADEIFVQSLAMQYRQVKTLAAIRIRYLGVIILVFDRQGDLALIIGCETMIQAVTESMDEDLD
jgi:hypothetical protein